MTAHADDDYAAVAVLDVNYCGYFADGYCLWPELKTKAWNNNKNTHKKKSLAGFATNGYLYVRFVARWSQPTSITHTHTEMGIRIGLHEILDNELVNDGAWNFVEYKAKYVAVEETLWKIHINQSIILIRQVEKWEYSLGIVRMELICWFGFSV